MNRGCASRSLLATIVGILCGVISLGVDGQGDCRDAVSMGSHAETDSLIAFECVNIPHLSPYKNYLSPFRYGEQFVRYERLLVVPLQDSMFARIYRSSCYFCGAQSVIERFTKWEILCD